MFFARKNLFSATDAFPLTDAVLEFDDSSSAASAAVRPPPPCGPGAVQWTAWGPGGTGMSARSGGPSVA